MNDDERLAHYLEIGAIEIAGIDESGEFIFCINESAKDSAPELWKAHEMHVDKTIMDLYEAGYLNIEYDENLEASFSLTEEGIKIAKEKGILPMEMPDTPNN